jgi:outer membrane autotransporter protein
MATFSGAIPTNILVSANATINTVVFTAAAPAYSFAIQSPNGFSFLGSGIINDSANAPSFSTNPGASLFFFNGSTAANALFTNNGTMAFFDSSTARTATITTNGLLQFLNTSSADHATITVNGGGSLGFRNSSTAANATIVNNGTIDFLDNSTVGNATVTTNSGGITFFQTAASGGLAQFITNAGGTFDISGLTNGGTTAGSIAGAGNYVLGTNRLTVGGNNLSTEVSGVISGSGGSLVKVGTGVLTLSGNNTYLGPTIVSQGVINLTGSVLSPVTVQPNGILGSTGTVFNTVTNAGIVAPGFGLAQGQFGALTVNNYVGQGGTLLLRTFLGTDGSPSDKLIINGGTADPSFMRIVNAGGPGAQTTANGILVVQAINGGTTVPGAFMLAGEVRAGAFDYDLFRGGLNGGAPNDWFLRSSFINGGGGPEEPIGPDPPPEPLPPGVWPIIGPELATYGVVQPVARQMGLATLSTFHERVGDAAADAACLTATPDNTAVITKAPPAPVNNCRPAVWGRVFGQQIDNRYRAFADPRASGQLVGLQTGVDVWRSSLIPGHSDSAGFYFAYGNGHVGVDGLVTNAAATAYILQHTGKLDLNAYSLGGYWTHYGPTGWYVDAVLQGAFYDGNAATQFAKLPTSGTGFISSLETGYPIPLPWFGPRFVLEPEAQILWQHVSFDATNDGLGPVALGATSGASGRLGLRGKWTISDSAGRLWQPYVLANVWQDWGANATTMFGPDPVPLIEHATRLEFAGGLSAKLFPGLSLYGQAGYQIATSTRQRRDGVKGDFGVHYSW